MRLKKYWRDRHRQMFVARLRDAGAFGGRHGISGFSASSEVDAVAQLPPPVIPSPHPAHAPKLPRPGRRELLVDRNEGSKERWFGIHAVGMLGWGRSFTHRALTLQRFVCPISPRLVGPALLREV